MKQAIRWSCTLGVLSMSIAGATFAQLPSFYAFIGAGYSDLEDMPEANSYANISDASGSTSVTNQNLGGRIGAGVSWKTSAYTTIGVELAGALYSSAKYVQGDTSTQFNYYGLELLGVGSLHLGRVALIGKAGIDEESMHPTNDNLDNDNIDDNEDYLPEVGAGIGYKATDHMQVSLMYYHTFGHDVSFDNSSNALNLPSVNAYNLEFGFYY